MAKLYRFVCDPNYPVCNGEIIFFVEDGKDGQATDISDVHAIARELARKYGFTNYKEKSSVLFLGSFFPRVEFKDNILTVQNGEY